MRGFVFSFARRRRRFSANAAKASSIPRFVHRYSSAMLFTFMFAGGMLLGSLSAKNADVGLLNKMDFLFTTNLTVRLQQPVFATFAASFASNFLFLIFVFLCGLAPWGMVAVSVAPAFKGFGTGLSAGYLFITYGFKGVGFYLLVMLGGTFIFTFTLIMECIQAQTLSCKIAKCVFLGDAQGTSVSVYVRGYLIRSLYFLILTAAASLADMMLWTAFSGLFF
ncbi:MAG: hypothetical protein IJA62_02170 [Ruminococcus sp.]|nr:hypothetical protein [Ruminococcus sp.]